MTELRRATAPPERLVPAPRATMYAPCLLAVRTISETSSAVDGKTTA